MIPTAGRRRSCDRAGRPPSRAMAVGGGRATTGLPIGHDGGQQGGQTAGAADRVDTR